MPIGSYPTPFLRYLLFYIGDQGVGYDPVGSLEGLNSLQSMLHVQGLVTRESSRYARTSLHENSIRAS